MTSSEDVINCMDSIEKLTIHSINIMNNYDRILDDDLDTVSNYISEIRVKENDSCIHRLVEYMKEYADQMQTSDSLEQIDEEINSLERKRQNLITKIAEKQKKITELKENNIAITEKQSRKLQKQMSQLEVYKLLTNVELCYNENEVSGYATNSNTRKITTFNYDKKKHTKQEITNMLYETISSL